MQISITARQCEISQGVRNFAEQRLAKLQKFASDIHGIHVVVTQQRGDFHAEIKLRINGHELVTTQEHAEAGAAIERAVDRMEEQIRRQKERRTDRKFRDTTRGAIAPAGAGDGDDATDEDLD